MQRLEDKVAIVTGGSSGYGRKISSAFAKEGAKVVITDIRKEPREGGFEEYGDLSTDELIEEEIGGKAEFFEGDVTVPEDMEKAVEVAVDSFGKLDIMVNNAGIYPPNGFLHERPVEDLEKAFDVNVKGVWNGCKAAIDQFLDQESSGNIINIVSDAGLYGWARQTAYNASKGAAKQITESLAVDYGPYNIRVNAICPGFSPTALTHEFYEDPDTRQKVIDMIPLDERWTMPEDIANLAVFLASEESVFIHGTCQVINGGQSLVYAHTRELYEE